MRRIILVGFISISLMGFKSKSELLEIADILKEVETNNNPQAVGDGGRAFGILQIHPECVEDVNRWYGTEYTHEDTKNPVIAKDIFVKYLTLGIKLYKKRCGYAPNEYEIVRMWNGGIYRGYEYPSTLKYLKKYQQAKALTR